MCETELEKDNKTNLKTKTKKKKQNKKKNKRMGSTAAQSNLVERINVAKYSYNILITYIGEGKVGRKRSRIGYTALKSTISN